MLAKPLRIFICAAEESGDKLGAPILKSLMMRYPHAQIRGIGGEAMREAGLKKQLFPMEELSLMGVFEILPKVPSLVKRISQTTQAILDFQPDIFLTIDGPDFSFRVHKKVKKKGLFRGVQMHCVAPSVWAWREGRAEKIAAFLDGLLCLFPFEPKYFEKVGLCATYMGHPYIQKKSDLPAKEELKKKWNISKDQKAIGLFLGSRKQEIENHGEIFSQSLKSFIGTQREDFKIIVPTFLKFKTQIEKYLSDVGLLEQSIIITDENLRQEALGGIDMALAVSGTIGFELALAGIPHCIGYRTSVLTHQVIKRFVKVKFAHLANIILDKAVVPEFLQYDCTSLHLSQSLRSIMEDSKQEDAFKRLNVIMSTKKPPSEIAADFIEEAVVKKT